MGASIAKIKLLLTIMLTTLILCATIITAAPSPEPQLDSAGTGYIPAFISNPSIYSYTIANQQDPNSKSPQQQQQQQYVNDNYNSINFATNANYRTSSNTNTNNNARSNFYYNSKDVGATSSTSANYMPTMPAVPTQPAPLSGCNLDRLAVYKVVLHTYWSRDLFPKHYPDWRPTAQWTKTLGRTHDASYALYHIGQQATPGVKQFAETGKTEILDSVVGEKQQQQQPQQRENAGNSFTSFVPTASFTNTRTSNGNQQQQKQHGERSVFDEFTIPAILNGAGRSEAKFFVDSNHSLVSLMTRIVPSPDWFIGVDSFQLCVGGSWIDTVTVELDPLDAGTDNGFTFTAPNWPTSPQGVIYRITSRYPAHPAGSFFYPKNKRLPPIATFQFIKLKEYELSEVFNFAEDDRKYETVKTQSHLETEHNHIELNNELSASIERERQNEISLQPTSETERDRIRTKLLAKMNPNYNFSATNVVPKNDKNAIVQNIVNSYRSRGGQNSVTSGAIAASAASLSSSATLSASSSLSTASSSSSAAASSMSTSSSVTSGTSMRRHRSKRPRDCRVSHWSEWTPCSKTCGIGEMHRYRKVIKHGKRGGRPCPPLQESKWCGSEKGCHSPASYFNWSNT